jgi:hypothetical protein
LVDLLALPWELLLEVFLALLPAKALAISSIAPAAQVAA